MASSPSKFVRALDQLTLKAQLKRLVEIADRCFVPHAGRYHERPYLQAVYKLYLEWAAKGKERSKAKQVAKILNREQRSDTHLIRLLIDYSAPGAKEKMRSKWSLALRFAKEKNVTPSGLIDFMEDPGRGGMAGCASGFAKLNKKQKQQRALKAKQQQKLAPKKKKQRKTYQTVSSKKFGATPRERRDGSGDDSTSW
jgi:hypothetical protein